MRCLLLAFAFALCLVPATVALQRPLGLTPRGTLLSMKQGDTDNVGGVGSKFVPVFVGVWAAGYSVLSFVETSGGEGLGDAGGAIGVAGVVVLALGLFAAAAYETFKE